MMKIKNKNGQIWVETVIYTLIGLTLLGLILAFAKPQIDEMRDRAIVEQGIEMLNNVDQVIDNIKLIPGNSRLVEIKIQKGEIKIDCEKDSIEYSIDKSKYKYSELNEEINVSRIKVLTVENGKMYDISLKLDYLGSLDITCAGQNTLKILQPASQPHIISIANKGLIDNIPNIDFL